MTSHSWLTSTRVCRMDLNFGRLERTITTMVKRNPSIMLIWHRFDLSRSEHFYQHIINHALWQYLCTVTIRPYTISLSPHLLCDVITETTVVKLAYKKKWTSLIDNAGNGDRIFPQSGNGCPLFVLVAVIFSHIVTAVFSLPVELSKATTWPKKIFKATETNGKMRGIIIKTLYISKHQQDSSNCCHNSQSLGIYPSNSSKVGYFFIFTW